MDHLDLQDYRLDVRWDQRGHSNSVAGQLLTRAAAPARDVPVLLVSNGRIVEETLTSELGEFQADGLPNDTLQIYALVGEDSCVAGTLEEGDA